MRDLFLMASMPWYTLILRRFLLGAHMLNLQRLAVAVFVVFLGWGAKPANAFPTIPLTESRKEQDILNNICPAFPAGACPISTATFTSDVESQGEIPDSMTIVFKSGNQGNVFT